MERFELEVFQRATGRSISEIRISDHMKKTLQRYPGSRYIMNYYYCQMLLSERQWATRPLFASNITHYAITAGHDVEGETSLTPTVGTGPHLQKNYVEKGLD